MLGRVLVLALCVTLQCPVSSQPPADPRVRVFPNGLTSIVWPKRGSDLVAIDVWVKAGSCYEQDDEKGSAHFLEHMLFRGTPRRPGGRADIEIESMGGLLNAGTTRHGAHVFAALSRSSAAAAIDVVADLLRNPVLDAKLMEVERRVILDESAGRRNAPVNRAAEAVLAAAFPDDSIGRPVLGSDGDITALHHPALVNFHRRRYVPANTVAVVAGDLTIDAGHRMVERALADWSQSSSAPKGSEPVPARRTIGPLRASSGGELVNGVVWSVPGDRASSARVEMEIIAEILGIRGASRPASTDVLPCAGGHLLRAWWPASDAATGASLRRLVERLASAGPTDSEVASARRRVQGRLLFETETVAGLARWLGDLATSEGPESALDFEKRLAASTRSGIRDFVSQRMAPIADGTGR